MQPWQAATTEIVLAESAIEFNPCKVAFLHSQYNFSNHPRHANRIVSARRAPGLCFPVDHGYDCCVAASCKAMNEMTCLAYSIDCLAL